MGNEYNPDYVSRPGDTLRETLRYLGFSVRLFSTYSGISEETLSGILLGNIRITEEIAEKLEKATAVSADFWLKRESDYRDSLK